MEFKTSSQLTFLVYLDLLVDTSMDHLITLKEQLTQFLLHSEATETEEILFHSSSSYSSKVY